MSLLDETYSQLGDSTAQAMQESIFGDLPKLPGDQPPAQESAPAPDAQLQQEMPMPQAPAAPEPPATGKDGISWVAGVGFVKRNEGNAAQQWEAAAGSPAPNFAAIQKHNADMLKAGGKSNQGGPGQAQERPASTSRYYTRKLARETFMNPNSSPEAKDEARMARRFNGAASPRSSMAGKGAWEDFFVNNSNNEFGAGIPGRGHEKEEIVPEMNRGQPTGGLRFKYLTDLT